MPANVLEVTPKTWNKDGQNITTYWVTLDDRTDDVPSYDERAKDLTKGPLPDGWEVATSAKGKPYLKAPKSGGKGGFAQSWYNSEAGVKYTQERMDRRTALMQAAAYFDKNQDDEDILDMALRMYEWLRASDSPSIGAAEGAPITSAVGGGGTRTDPKPPERPEANEGNGDGEAPALTPVDGGGTTDGGVVLPPIHVHTFKDAPREGWVMCADCGAAEKKKVPHG